MSKFLLLLFLWAGAAFAVPPRLLDVVESLFGDHHRDVRARVFINDHGPIEGWLFLVRPRGALNLTALLAEYEGEEDGDKDGDGVFGRRRWRWRGR